MKTKILLVIALSFMTFSSAFAWCGFTDHFYIAPGSETIRSISADHNLTVRKMNNSSFTISDDGSCAENGGTVTIVVGPDDSNYSTLKIQDGTNDMNPSVVYINNVGNIQYTGVDHPKYSYKYTLKFNR